MQRRNFISSVLAFFSAPFLKRFKPKKPKTLSDEIIEAFNVPAECVGVEMAYAEREAIDREVQEAHRRALNDVYFESTANATTNMPSGSNKDTADPCTYRTILDTSMIRAK